MRLIAIVLLFAACASAPPANDIDLQIKQSDAAGIQHDVREGIELEITVANRSAVPWTVESIGVQTTGRAEYLTITRRMERFDRLIAPGTEETFRRWWPAIATIDFQSVEIPVRIEVYLVGADGTRRTETFSRMLDAWVTKVRR